MANQSKQYLDNLIKLSGGIGAYPNQNTPAQYANRQTQYFAQQTTQFIKERAQYASDFVQAQVQGIINNNFYEYVTTNIRLADIASQSATSTKKTDDVKIVLFAEPIIDYFPIGAKLQTMGSTWLCINPSNISSVHGTAVIQRCNAAFCAYDYYGNIITEPIIVEKVAMASNDNSNPQNLVMMEGYFNVTCQLNQYTQALGQNQRIILGSKAYHITGFTDFIQEFTGNYDSVHLLNFTIRIEEPTENDDLVNHIANGNTQSFTAQISGANELQQNASTQLTAYFIKNSEVILPTDNYPLTWNWESATPQIATISETGLVTGITAGQAQITATLQENNLITSTFTIQIVQSNNTSYIAFIGFVPASISQYQSQQITAMFYEEGIALSSAVIAWEFSGAATSSYYTELNGNTLTITCLKADDVPLTITASYGEYEITTEIQLEGY